MDALSAFHPAIRAWFERRFPLGPTPPQAKGWPAIEAGHDTLIAAPTGSGKTLSAFLVCIDRFFKRASAAAEQQGGVEIVYVSPLKALAADIHQNLEGPLEEIRAIAREQGRPLPELRVALRSGDTAPAQRAAMLRRPPHILVTTPESLYLMVTAEKSRAILRGVRTVIVDEIHAVARDKRGSHLALTLERLDALCHSRPARIGLSATQRPIETIARLLVGAGTERSRADGSPRCEIIDEGHRRELDLALELPEGELEAVISREQMGDVIERIAAHVEKRRTTLIFVNTRRMAERLAHWLAERLGEEAVAAHHGSLSKDRRLRVETRLRAGELKALVATASLELGIDVGPVELVCQLGSPRSFSTFIQRVGRSGHFRGGLPTGRLYPLTRDELVECAALLRGVAAGRLDAVTPPEAPLDILAQQVVAACGAEEWHEDALFELVRGASPFAELERADFDDIVDMLSEGITTGRGRRAAYLHRDRVNGMLRGRRGARMAALTSGGAIPETALYTVLADPDDTRVGTVDEDWAIESMAGDIFLLGSTSWRIRRIESGVVRVSDAGGAPPSIPFWRGEAPGRSGELSQEVSLLRARVAAFLDSGDRAGAEAWVARECGIEDVAASQLIDYLAAAYAALGAVLPSQEEIVFERFFDEAGGMQLVVHAPFGTRINRGFGLALRKRFCRSFNFELQAAANDDAIVLSLGPQHSFPLSEVPGFLKPATVEETLAQAVLSTPLFTARWRWNLNRALVVLRMRGGKRNPPPIQRMEADDLLAAIFPGLAACQEHQQGPIEIPDHPLVRQTMVDCLHEAMDIDDAPLEERRTRAVTLRRGLPVAARELGRLDPDAIARVRDEVRPRPRDADELHDLLLTRVLLRPVAEWGSFFELLVGAGRACMLVAGETSVWCAMERRRDLEQLFPGARVLPERPLPAALAALAALPTADAEAVVLDIVRGHLEGAGPAGIVELAARTALSSGQVEIALARLEADGFALRGSFDVAAESPADSRAEAQGEQYCARHLLERIHRYTKERLRREIEPVTARDLLRFLLAWQHATPGTRRDGRTGLLATLEQLQGFEAAAGSWEESLLPARVQGYRGEWLDGLCLSGDAVWGRLSQRGEDTQRSLPGAGEDTRASEAGGLDGGGAESPRRGGMAPSRATPLGFALRSDLPWLLAAMRGDRQPDAPGPGAALDVLELLGDRGALFHSEVAASLRRLPVEVEEGLWDLVARGLVTADGFQAVRSLLGTRDRWARRSAGRRARRGLRRGLQGAGGAEGRWSLFPGLGSREEGASADRVDFDADELAEAVAEQLLARWGVVFRDLVVRENLIVPWRDILWAFRRMEARGTVRGGRFVTGFVGEQYALPSAVDGLRRTRRTPLSGEVVRLSAADPLNLVGILTPGPRIPALRSNEVVYRDGLPVDGSEGGAAAAEGGRALRDAASQPAAQGDRRRT
ncbi:MAG: DEAD/DEAH box helicase [Deltaproteobacteria bacterium]|nr:DEAD/DEAH box helicase [Deltaproteobacteria bacterium]